MDMYLNKYLFVFGLYHLMFDDRLSVISDHLGPQFLHFLQ